MTLDELSLELGRLAMQFRGCKHQHDVLEQRKEIAAKYAAIVSELIESGIWNETPTLEEQLTDEYMPKQFFIYWKIHD